MNMNITKHVGKLKNTGVRVVVVFRELPGDENHALIVESDRLPDRFHDNLMGVLNTDEAKATNDLYDVLNRHMLSDGGIILKELHNRGHLRRVSVDDVVMLPLPNHPVPLRMINKAIAGTLTADEAKKMNQPAEAKPVTESKEVVEEPKVDTNLLVPEGASEEDKGRIAANLLHEATFLEQEANKKREQAYALNPELRPKPGRPELTEEEKKQRNEERNRKRREERQEKKAKASESELDKKVAEKLERDAKGSKKTLKD